MEVEGKKNVFVALLPEILQGKVLAEPHVEAEFRTEVNNFANLCLQDVARQAVFRNAEVHHSTGHLGGFENGDAIPEQRQVVRRRLTSRARAAHGYLFRPEPARRAGKTI